jgi:hypothetical protein
VADCEPPERKGDTLDGPFFNRLGRSSRPEATKRVEITISCVQTSLALDPPLLKSSRLSRREPWLSE